MTVQNRYVGKHKIKDALQQNIDEKTYFMFLQQLIDEIQQNKNAGVQVILNMDMIECENGKCVFQKIKEDSIVEFNTMKEFIKEMAFVAIFDESADCSEVTEFLHFLDNGENCRTLRDVYEYCIDQTYEEQNFQPQKEMPKPDDSAERHISEPTVPQDETGVLDPEFWNRINQGNRNPQNVHPNNSSAVYGNMNSPAYNGDETGVLDPDYWNHVNETRQNAPMKAARTEMKLCRGQLLHRKSGVAIDINQGEFWIGKNQSDLIINKPTISRKHAVIMQKGNHFFIKDNGSTNRTYVNNQEIPPNASVEIFHGNFIKFADEEYEFQIMS